MVPPFLEFAVFFPFLCSDLPLCVYGAVDPSLSGIGTGILCLFFYLLCYAAVLKKLTYYAQNYARE